AREAQAKGFYCRELSAGRQALCSACFWTPLNWRGDARGHRIRPIDMTAEQLAQQTKERERIRRAAQRRKKGIRTKEAYLAEFADRPKPWLAEGVSQRWERRRKQLSRLHLGDVATRVRNNS